MSATNFISLPSITEPDLQDICFKYFPFFIRFELTRNHFYQRMNVWYFLHYSLAKEFGHQNQLRCAINDQQYKIYSSYLLSEFIKETVQMVDVFKEISSCKEVLIEIVRELSNDSDAERKVELLECKHFSEEDAQTISTDYQIDRLQNFVIAFKKIKRNLKDWNVDISKLDMFLDCEYEIDYSKSRAFFLQNYPQIFKEQPQIEQDQCSHKFSLVQLYAYANGSSDCEQSSNFEQSSSSQFSNSTQSPLNLSSQDQSFDATYLNLESTRDQSSLFDGVEESIEYVSQIDFWDLVDNELSPYELTDSNEEISNYQSEIDMNDETNNSLETSQSTPNSADYDYFDPLNDYLLDHNSFHSSSAQQVDSSLRNEPSLPIMEQLKLISDQIQSIEPEPQPCLSLQVKKMKKTNQKRSPEPLSLLKPVEKPQQQQQQIMDSFQEQRLFRLLKPLDQQQARKLIENLQLVEQQLPESSFLKRQAQRIVKLLQQHSQQQHSQQPLKPIAKPDCNLNLLRLSQLPHLDSVQRCNQNSLSLAHHQAQQLTLLKEHHNKPQSKLKPLIFDKHIYSETPQYPQPARKCRNQCSSVILDLLRQKTLQRQKEREDGSHLQKRTEDFQIQLQNQLQTQIQNRVKEQIQSHLQNQLENRIENQIENRIENQKKNQKRSSKKNTKKKKQSNSLTTLETKVRKQTKARSKTRNKMN